MNLHIAEQFVIGSQSEHNEFHAKYKPPDISIHILEHMPAKEVLEFISDD